MDGYEKNKVVYERELRIMTECVLANSYIASTSVVSVEKVCLIHKPGECGLRIQRSKK